MSGKRRVAVFISDMNKAGGLQRVAANLVRDLRPHYETTLLSAEPISAPVFYEPGLDFRSLNIPSRPFTYSGRFRSLIEGGWALRRFVANNRIDTVLAFWYDWASATALALPRSVKKVGCEHISFFEPTSRWQLIRAKTYWRLDAVVSLTEQDAPHLSSISRSVHVIPNYSLTAQPSQFEMREKILLTIGHLEMRKGIDRLLWGLKKPLLDNPDWKLVVVGGGEKGHVDWGYIHYVSGLLTMLQLEGRVELHPATSRIDEWYRRASIYVMGSRREGLPMVLIEAKANGLPIVSFDCPTGPKEVIRSGLDGFLVEDDSEAFAEAASALMANTNLRRNMGEAARNDHEERFSSDSVIAKWCNLIEGLHRDDPSHA